MLKKSGWTSAEAGRTLVILLAGIAIGAPAMAGNIYSWRTHGGDIAFTDNIKNVPSRYREQVDTRPAASLADYARFSSQDPEETESYGERLQARLVHLQWLNESLEPQPIERPSLVGTASLRIGGSADPVLNLTGDAGGAPVIVERVRVIGVGQIATRHDTFVRQGGRTLGIIRGNQELETGLLSNVVSEEGLERYH